MRRFRFTFLKFSSTYRLISLLFNEKSRLKSQNLKRSRVRKFWAKLFKKPTKCRNGALHQSGVSKFCRSANQNQVILPSIEGKLRKNALCLNQSAFSNFALYVINNKSTSFKRTQTPKQWLKWSVLLSKTCIKRTLKKSFCSGQLGTFDPYWNEKARKQCFLLTITFQHNHR